MKMKNKHIWLSILILIIFLSLWGIFFFRDGVWNKINNNTINLDAINSDTINSEKPIKTIYVDVRTVEEYNQWHLKDSINYPLDKILSAKTSSELPFDINDNILLYCRSWNRSWQALKKMEELGFNNLTNLWGYNDLKNKWYEVIE